MRPWTSRFIAVGVLLAYWTVSLRHVTIVPPVYEDEPWQASTGWKLASEGVFGSDLFAGYYGMEQRYYGYMPVHPMLLAAVYRVAGVGLFQSRFESVTLGLLALALTYTLGRRLFGPSAGVLALAMLLIVRTAGLTRSTVTGIVMLDFARIARYDMAVPVFGLLALHAYLNGRRAGHGRQAWLALTGVLVGLAGLSHLYGVFWLPALAALAALDGRRHWRDGWALVLGFGAPWFLYGLYVLSGWPDWSNQMQDYAPRFNLLNAAWYWSNLVGEVRRYGPGLGPPGWQYLLRPGFWAAAVAWPVALAWLTWRGIRHGDWRARAIVLPLLALQGLFALLLTQKLANYLVAVLPLAAVAVAGTITAMWRGCGNSEAGRWLRRGLAAAGLAVAMEGSVQVAALPGTAASTTPYATFVAQVRAYLPAEGRVLGLHNYWFGLEDRNLRSWLVPLSLAAPFHPQGPVPIETVLDEIAPAAILLDHRIDTALRTAAADDPRPGAIAAWMAARGYELAGVVDDPTYGRVAIYQLPPR